MLRDSDIIARAISNKRYCKGNRVLPQAFHHPKWQMGKSSCELSFIQKNKFKEKADFWDVCDNKVFRKDKATISSADIIVGDVESKIEKPIFLDLKETFEGHCCLNMNMELQMLARKLSLISTLDWR